MATLLSIQRQLQQSNNPHQLHYIAPNVNVNATTATLALHHGHHQHLVNQGPDHFCKDCGVMFESSTSLEVHLSYHKENLLTRWANQDALDKSSNSSSGSGSHYANPSSPSPSKRELSRSDNSSVESNASSQYYHPLPVETSSASTHSYLPPLYNNNTGDQHIASGPTTPSANSTYRSAPTGPHSNSSNTSGFMLSQPQTQQPPVESGNSTMYDTFHSTNFQPQLHPGHLNLQLGGGGHPLFSPGHHTHPGPPSSGGSDHHQTQGPPPARDSAEILDLDSHKVHIYQHQQQQQQSFFHRPYLPHLLPPLPPPNQPGGGGGGWPTPDHHFSSRFSPASLPGGGGGYPQLDAPFYAPPTPTSGPPTGQSGMTPTSTFEILRMENPNYAPPPPNSEAAAGFPLHQQQQGHQGSNGLVPFGHQSPYAVSQQQQQQQLGQSQQPPPPPPNSSVGVNKKNGKTGGGAQTKGGTQRSTLDNPGPGSKNGGNGSPPVKTKGWKGGECKRPKTYNCPACNKWFTSSGHLKRHYGTTLHKNSMKQLGDSAEELFKNQPKRKGAKQQSNSSTEPKTPKQGKKAKSLSNNSNLNNNDIGGGGLLLMDSEMRVKKESNPALLYGGGGHDLQQQQPHLNGNGLNNGGGGNNNGDLLPKPYHSPSSSPPNQFNFNIYSLSPNSHQPHHLIPPHHHQQPSPHQYAPPPHSHPQLGGSGGGPPPQYLTEFAPVPPTSTNFNGFHHQPHQQPGGEPSRSEVNNGPLPPFSSVGLSHYDAGMDPNFQNRVSPTYIHGQQQMTPNHSPHNNSVGMNGGHRENSYERENGSPYEGGHERSSRGGGSDHGGGGGGGGGGSDGGGSLDGMLLEGSSGSEDGGSSTSVASAEGRKAKPEVHECPLCSKTFNRSCYFKQHFKQQHSNSHSGGQLYKCSTCGKRFPEPGTLSDHIAKHGSDKPYKCELCPKQFNHKTDLNRHRLLHTGDRPFSCDLCGKGFIRKDHMTKHAETHRKKSLHIQQTLSNSRSNSESPPNSQLPTIDIKMEMVTSENLNLFS